MARGRMISTTIGESRKFAALDNHLHRLIYLMVLPHVDKAGRFEADPIVIKSKCLMRLDVDSTTVQAWLNDGVSTGLLRVYEVNGLHYLEIVDFHKHNTPHYKEPESEIPPPEAGTPCYTQKTNVTPTSNQHQPDDAPTKAIREEKKRELRREEKRTHSSEKINPTNNLALAATPPRAQTHDPGLFMEAWNANRGRLPAVTILNGKRKAAIRALVKEHGPDTALNLLRDATRAVAADDFWIERQYGFDNLLTGNKLVARADQWRAGGIQLGPGNTRLANYAATVASAIGGLDDQPN